MSLPSFSFLPGRGQQTAVPTTSSHTEDAQAALLMEVGPSARGGAQCGESQGTTAQVSVQRRSRSRRGEPCAHARVPLTCCTHQDRTTRRSSMLCLPLVWSCTPRRPCSLPPCNCLQICLLLPLRVTLPCSLARKALAKCVVWRHGWPGRFGLCRQIVTDDDSQGPGRGLCRGVVDPASPTLRWWEWRYVA